MNIDRFALSLLVSNVSPSIVPWTSKYVLGEDIIRYISIENKKKVSNEESSVSNCVTILVHTSVPFYHQFQSESDPEIIGKIIERLYLHLPSLRSDKTKLETSLLHRWPISQVISSPRVDNIDGGSIEHPDSIEHSFFVNLAGDGDLQTFPFLGIAGDYFTESNFTGCSKSARSLVKKIQMF